MNRIILLDSGPLGMITHPRKNAKIKFWLQSLLQSGTRVQVPEIADYEVRRELLRVGKIKGLQRLDFIISELGLVSINREVMLKAAELWAESRQRGQPTANNQALDADVILAALAFSIINLGQNVVIATTNVRHLSRFVPAQMWNEINLRTQ